MTRFLMAVFAFAMMVNANSAVGQVFGTRSVKRSLARQGNDNVGIIKGDERFIRGRRQDNFVGADQGEMSGFVGSEQARVSGRIASPTGGIQVFLDRSVRINRVIPRLQKRDFYPSSIQLPSELVAATSHPAYDQYVEDSLNRELQMKVNESIEVSVANRSARLRGVVPSANQKSLAELLIRFEPGIDEIRNEIEVADR